MSNVLPAAVMAALIDFRGAEDVLIPLAVFAFVGTIVVSSMYFKHQKQKLWHETARLALEKGQPVPGMPKDEEASHGHRGGGDIRAGLVLVATGLGLFLFFEAITRKPGAGLVGAIPGFIGAALLLHGILMGQRAKDRRGSDPRPPLT